MNSAAPAAMASTVSASPGGAGVTQTRNKPNDQGLLFLILLAILFPGGLRFLLAVLLPALFGSILAVLLRAAAHAKGSHLYNQIEVRGVALMPCEAAIRFKWWDNTNDAMGSGISSWLGYFTGLENVSTAPDLLPGKENKIAIALVYQQCKVFIRRHEKKFIYDAALTTGSRFLKKRSLIQTTTPTQTQIWRLSKS